MTAPQLVDTYCKAGGATKGYQRAGFYVVGVDKDPQPNYCGDEFIQADALEVLADREFLSGFDAIHASPPCQAFSRITSTRGHPSSHADLLSPTRDHLLRSGIPWVIENVPGAPMRTDLRLCGCIFGLQVQRERWFETSWRAFDLRSPCQHSEAAVGVYGYGGERGSSGRLSGRLSTWRRAMGIDWMEAQELAQAVPPAYTEYVGLLLMAHLRDVTA